MVFFYLIHNMNWGQELTNAQRNCRTFLYGIVIYAIVYVLIKNMHIHGYLGMLYDAIYTVFMIILFADIAVMAYTYRTYYGRNILYELGSNKTSGSGKTWYYDPVTHKYMDQLPKEDQLASKLREQQIEEEYELKKELLTEEMQKRREKYEQAKRRKELTEKLIDDKNKLRATVMIQRWWRRHLYNVPNGVFYIKAKQHFIRGNLGSP